MNLADVVVGALVFSAASGASLQIAAGSLHWAGAHHQRQNHHEAVALALAAGQLLLERQAAAGGAEPRPACEQAAAELAGALAELPLADGLERQLRQQDGLVRLTISAPEQPPRQRWFSPAAYGLCRDQA
ncbi:MAG: hypothetical protein VKK94_01685 [Cyanobacteriota bacterium]|jgi:hypothetical protein|nr:hypothetical protein [Cyanobacteriota bacterium]